MKPIFQNIKWSVCLVTPIVEIVFLFLQVFYGVWFSCPCMLLESEAAMSVPLLE